MPSGPTSPSRWRTRVHRRARAAPFLLQWAISLTHPDTRCGVGRAVWRTRVFYGLGISSALVSGRRMRRRMLARIGFPTTFGCVKGIARLLQIGFSTRRSHHELGHAGARAGRNPGRFTSLAWANQVGVEVRFARRRERPSPARITHLSDGGDVGRDA